MRRLATCAVVAAVAGVSGCWAGAGMHVETANDRTSGRAGSAHRQTPNLVCSGDQREMGFADYPRDSPGARTPRQAAQEWAGPQPDESILVQRTGARTARVLLLRQDGTPHTVVYLGDRGNGWLVGTEESCAGDR